MSDNHPIGVFDSGLGGLTVVKEITKVLPHESIIYIGDTARVPYGNRSPETVTQFSTELVDFLISQQVKAIVVACATASSVALPDLKQSFPDIPLYGVIDATAEAAVKAGIHHHYGIIGTRATVNSQSFDHALHERDSQAKIKSVACPLFVPIIEEGIFGGNILNTVIDHYLSTFPQSIDALILGCTHYPLISPALQAYFPRTKLINPGLAVTSKLNQELTRLQLLTDNQKPTHQLYATDVTKNFKHIGEIFLGAPVSIHHHRLNA